MEKTKDSAADSENKEADLLENHLLQEEESMNLNAEEPSTGARIKKDFDVGDVVFIKIPSDIAYRPALILRQETPLSEGERLVKYFDTGTTSIVKLAYIFEFSTEGELFNQLRYQSEEFVRDVGVMKAIEHLGKDKAALLTPAKTPTKAKPKVELSLSKEEFLDDLYQYMEKIGQPILKIPSLGYQELDLYKLYKLVISRGGMDQVTRDQEWKSVYQELGIPTMSTSASYNTRTNYKKFLYLYELEHFQPESSSPATPSDFNFKVGEYVKIVSPMVEGTVFYAQIVKRRFQGINVYYVHYNGWSNSHDEWMPESVISPLNEEESKSPKHLMNPSPSRSSKSNHIIYDPLITEKHFHPKHKRSSSKKSDSDDVQTPTMAKRVRTTSGGDYSVRSPKSMSDSQKVRLSLRTRLSDYFYAAQEEEAVPHEQLKLLVPDLQKKSRMHSTESGQRRISKKNLHTFDYSNRSHLDYSNLAGKVPVTCSQLSGATVEVAPRKSPSGSPSEHGKVSFVDQKYIDNRTLSQVQESIASLTASLAKAKERYKEQLALVKEEKQQQKTLVKSS